MERIKNEEEGKKKTKEKEGAEKEGRKSTSL